MPWHEDAFLLLPGDGFLLVDEGGCVRHVDRFAPDLVPDCPAPGADLAQAWPDAADGGDRCR